MYVDSQRKLHELCARLARSTRLALDTEFVGERTYFPTLGVIQVADGHLAALIDPLAVESLEPFLELVVDRRVEKVLHSGKQDLAIFHRLTGQVPSPVCDTQIAAAMIGFGEQPSYAKLVERLAGVRLDKKETFTDWTRRPLADAQIRYALDDVRYLLPVYERLMERVRRRGRTQWVREEWRKLEEPTTYETLDPEEQFRQVRRMGSLDGQGLAVLKALASWRERRARELNRPRAKVLADELLVEIARRAPRTLQELQAIRSLVRREVEKQAQPILEAVEQGLQSPAIHLGKGRRSGQTDDLSAAVDLLFSFVKSCASREGIATSILISRSELTSLVEEWLNNGKSGSAVLRGWRKDLLGSELIALLEGKLALGLDMRTKSLKPYPVGRPRP